MVSALLVSVAALTTAGRHPDLQDAGEQPFAKTGEVAFRLSAVDQGQMYRVFVYYANEAKGPVKILEPMRNRCYFEYEERWKDATGAVIKAEAFEAEHYPMGLNASLPESALVTLPETAIVGRTFTIFRAKRQRTDSEIWIRCKHHGGLKGWNYLFQTSWCRVEKY